MLVADDLLDSVRIVGEYAAEFSRGREFLQLQRLFMLVAVIVWLFGWL